MRGIQAERRTMCVYRSTRLKQIAQSRQREHEILLCYVWFSHIHASTEYNNKTLYRMPHKLSHTLRCRTHSNFPYELADIFIFYSTNRFVFFQQFTNKITSKYNSNDTHKKCTDQKWTFTCSFQHKTNHLENSGTILEFLIGNLFEKKNCNFNCRVEVPVHM